jgi:hypothetical protein
VLSSDLYSNERARGVNPKENADEEVGSGCIEAASSSSIEEAVAAAAVTTRTLAAPFDAATTTARA